MVSGGADGMVKESEETHCELLVQLFENVAVLEEDVRLKERTENKQTHNPRVTPFRFPM